MLNPRQYVIVEAFEKQVVEEPYMAGAIYTETMMVLQGLEERLPFRYDYAP